MPGLHILELSKGPASRRKAGPWTASLGDMTLLAMPGTQHTLSPWQALALLDTTSGETGVSLEEGTREALKASPRLRCKVTKGA